jgi:hypothetical protein
LWVAERYCEIRGITNPDVLHGIIVGSEFPDIRYITHAPRELTHPLVLDIREIEQSATPFEAGMKLHAWLDLKRENFIRKEVYAAITPFEEGHPATLLKLVEEEILSDFYDGRRWSVYFDKVLPEERVFAQENDICKWHGVIQWMMSVRPSWLIWCQSFQGPAFGASANTLYTWSYLLPELKQNPILQDHLHDFLAYIEAEIFTISSKNTF